MELDIGARLSKRREALRDSLKYSGTEASLLRDLKERRLHRQSLSTTLEQRPGQPRSPTRRVHDEVDTHVRDEVETTQFGGEIEREIKHEDLRRVRERAGSTRFDTARSQAQSTGKEKSSRWKSLSSQVGSIAKRSEDQDGFDFFTTALDDFPSATAAPDEDMQHEEHVDEEQEYEEHPVETMETDYGDAFQYPLYTPHRDRLTNEGEVYFRVTSVQEQEYPVNDIDEEGFYVGGRPTISSSHVRTMQNRLLQRKPKDTEWLGDDVPLLGQNNPLRILHTRPHLMPPDDVHAHFQLAEIRPDIDNRISPEFDCVFQVELDISSIHFLHHPLFSFEHVLSSQLEEAYQKYSNWDKNAAEYYYLKLQALKTKLAHLQQSSKNDKDMSFAEVQSCISVYRKEIHTTRQLRKKAIAAEYFLSNKILRLWKSLKDLRDNQGYSNTTTTILIDKVETNAVEEELQLKREIEDELQEIREDFQDQYLMQLQEYQSQITKWKRKSYGRLDEVAEEATSADLLASASRESRPIPPTDFNESEVRHQLNEYYNTHYKPPGEPLYIPQLHHTNAITQQCPPDEQLRRDDANRGRLQVKVFFNGQQVSQTKESNLNSDFSVYFGEVFSIQISQWPESIKLQIVESKLLISNVIAEVYVPMPEVQQTTKSQAGTEQYQFTSSAAATFSHSAVGSGSSHPSLPEAGVLLTTGNLSAGICWAVDDSGKVLCPHQSQSLSSKHDAVASLGSTGIANLQEVKKWIENSRLDPNDPRNAELLQLIESVPSSSMQPDFFQLASVDEVETFVAHDEFSTDKRFSMLVMRDDGHSGLRNKVVPLSSKSISGSVWQDIVGFKDAGHELPLRILGDFYTKKKEEQAKFLLDIRERVLSHIRSAKNVPLLSEVVISEFIPNISALKSTVVEVFTPRRPLKPVRRERKKLEAKNLTLTNVNVIIRVIRAFNVPVREDGMRNLEDMLANVQHDAGSQDISGVRARDNSIIKSEGLVSPFIEVTYEDTVLRTARACGQNPFWNEELVIPVQFSEDDVSRSKLQVLTHNIHFNLFDEVVVDILEDDRKRGSTMHYRVEKKWLGKFTLPFSTLIGRTMVDGTFQLDVPLMLLGYQKCSTKDNPLLGYSTSSHTHLQIFVKIDPSLDIFQPLKEKFPSNEDIGMLEHASKWLKSLREKFPLRYYTATALDINGKHVFITRYIKPQNPPPEFTSPGNENRVKLMEGLAHYVSLIPFMSDAVVFSENCNIWSTSDQFLQMLGGDEEEHATLLCNYFLFCGFKAWVLLGHAVPEGETAYVLTEDPQPGSVEYWLWNPSTGCHYSQHEPHTPLVSVGCMFDDKNVWGNIQAYDDPSRILFDVSNHKHWSPLYSDKYETPTSIQQDLQYSDTPQESVMELQERIERSLRDHIMKLRPNITRWNRHCSRTLQSLLPTLESNTSTVHDSGELAEFKASYQLAGFPIHIRYSDIQHLLTTVERTGVHLCEDKKVEYALAVHVQSYSNDVISVWIYVVSMIPR